MGRVIRSCMKEWMDIPRGIGEKRKKRSAHQIPQPTKHEKFSAPKKGRSKKEGERKWQRAERRRPFLCVQIRLNRPRVRPMGIHTEKIKWRTNGKEKEKERSSRCRQKKLEVSPFSQENASCRLFPCDTRITFYRPCPQSPGRKKQGTKELKKTNAGGRIPQEPRGAREITERGRGRGGNRQKKKITHSGAISSTAGFQNRQATW